MSLIRPHNCLMALVLVAQLITPTATRKFPVKQAITGIANTDTTKQTNGTYFIQHTMFFVIHGFYESYKVRWQRLVQISNLSLNIDLHLFAEKGFLHTYERMFRLV
jgi:hypothetical protein